MCENVCINENILLNETDHVLLFQRMNCLVLVVNIILYDLASGHEKNDEMLMLHYRSLDARKPVVGVSDHDMYSHRKGLEA